MYNDMASSIKHQAKLISSMAILSIATQVFSSNLEDHWAYGHVVAQVGTYWSIQGTQQHINIDDLIGDEFSVTQNGGSSGLVGLGYFIDGQEKNYFKMTYGINAFYLAPTQVSGHITQENLFTNLTYSYQVAHYPVYAIAKSTINTPCPQYNLTLDAGIGPNFMRVSDFKETPLDDMTLPDKLFSSNTTTTFSATIGAGIKINHVFGHAPLECGYRFFYLGQGHFDKANTQVVNALSTGTSYANAVMCSITF